MRQTLTHYGWAVVTIIVICAILMLSTPFAKYVGNSMMNAADSLYTSLDFQFNDGYKEVLQDENWEYKVVGLTTPINEDCTKITYDEFLEMQGIPKEEVETEPESTTVTETVSEPESEPVSGVEGEPETEPEVVVEEKFAIAIALTKYTGNKHRVVVPNLYKDGDKTYVVTSVGIPTKNDSRDTGPENDSVPRNNVFGGDSDAGATSVVVSSGIDVNPYAFHGCNSLGTLVLTKTNIINNHAFDSCSSLYNVSLGNDTDIIGDFAFANCERLEELDFGKSLTNIGASAFHNCKNLVSVKFPNTLDVIGNSAFTECTSLKIANFENTSLTLIDDAAFKNCSTLTGSLRLPATVVTIGKEAFYNCTSLNGTLFLPDEIAQIYDSAFEKCNFIKTDFTRLNSLSFIGNSAFNGCKNMSFAFVAPSSLKYIGASAFAGCAKCSDVVLSEGLVSIGSGAFSGVVKTISSPTIIPSTCSDLGGTLSFSYNEGAVIPNFASGAPQFSVQGTTEYIVAEGNTAFKAENGKLYSMSGGLIATP